MSIKMGASLSAHLTFIQLELSSIEKDQRLFTITGFMITSVVFLPLLITGY